MRPIHIIAAACAALVCAAPASAALPEEGFLVYKDSRLSSATEVRAKGTGRLIATVEDGLQNAGSASACSDPTFELSGPRWKRFEEYRVNIASTPTYIRRAATLADLIAAHEAWESPFVTDCPQPSRTAYEAKYGGPTTRNASLVASLTADGLNVVSFQSLAGTVCDGATACVVLDFRNGRIREADMALEQDLTRYGFQDFWTTEDETWWNESGGRWAVSDAATHEWGHFAGLGHVDDSPSLTMYPFVHDGAQTLGLGDMLGIAARYNSKRDD
ncbi:MAG: hypothetical protein H0U90_10275 [Actinobacteria bacterium]|nr:hypothetical protein [Actinomycetota bacterium]